MRPSSSESSAALALSSRSASFLGGVVVALSFPVVVALALPVAVAGALPVVALPLSSLWPK
jgi:hypothetical protein